VTDFELIEIQAATMFVPAADGRMLRENDPDQSPGPRLYLGGCASGNIVRIRHDVGDETARAITGLAAEEPPLIESDHPPRHLNEYVRLLEAEEPVRERAVGLVYHLPSDIAHKHRRDVPFTFSATPEGDRLLSALAEQGMPQALVEVGFVAVTDFWEPWCVAFHGAEIASIAFAARLGPDGADAGLNTMPRFRGQGFGPAVTAAWASHPSLRERTLFYSTDRTNRASRRVAEKLSLRFIGASLRLA
jgi:RimJ/RimL family protein N-acetyltransferase